MQPRKTSNNGQSRQGVVLTQQCTPAVDSEDTDQPLVPGIDGRTFNTLCYTD